MSVVQTRRLLVRQKKSAVPVRAKRDASVRHKLHACYYYCWLTFQTEDAFEDIIILVADTKGSERSKKEGRIALKILFNVAYSTKTTTI
jgi:hypothetical protein